MLHQRRSIRSDDVHGTLRATRVRTRYIAGIDHLCQPSLCFHGCFGSRSSRYSSIVLREAAFLERQTRSTREKAWHFVSRWSCFPDLSLYTVSVYLRLCVHVRRLNIGRFCCWVDWRLSSKFTPFGLSLPYFSRSIGENFIFLPLKRRK